MIAVSVSVTVHWNVTSYSLMERRHCCRTTCFRHLQPWTWRQVVFLKRWWLHTRPRSVTFQGAVYINFEHLSWRSFQCPLPFRMLPINNSTLSNILSMWLVNSYWLILYLPSYFGGGCGGWEFCHNSSDNMFSLWFVLRSVESVTNGICNSVLILKYCIFLSLCKTFLLYQSSAIIQYPQQLKSLVHRSSFFWFAD